MTLAIEVVVLEPWLRDKRHRYIPGQRAMLSVEEYRRWKDLDYIAREFVPAVHWSGRAYFHAVCCKGRLIRPPQKRPTLVMHVPEPVTQAPRAIPERAVVLPLPNVVRRGCGCRKKESAA